MRRFIKPLIALLLLGAAAGGYVYYAGGRKPEGPKYDTVKLDKGRIVARVTATGTLSALVTVQVGAQVSGRIAQLMADFNTPVKKGQKIARIDPQLFRAAVEQARANLMAASGNWAKAKAQALDAKRQALRQKALRDQKLVSQADADTTDANARAMQAGVAAAAGQVAQARAALHQAEINFAYTTIVSPIDGVVISRNVDVGQTVAAALQAPTLFTIAEDLRKMQVDTSVAEADVGRLKSGGPASFTVDAYPGERFRGQIRQIRNAPQTVQNVVTYDAVIDVGNPELKLKPGMTANVTFVYAEKEDVLKVPNTALRFRPPPALLAKLGGGAGGAQNGGPSADGGVASGAIASGGAAASDAPSGEARKGRRRGGEGNASGDRPGGAGGVDGGPRRGGGDDGPSDRRSVWVLRDGAPVRVPIRIGISDGTVTEVVEGELKEGDTLIIDVDTGRPSAPAGGAPGGPMRRIL